MIDSVEHFESVSSQNLIISIDKEPDFIRFAILCNAHVDVRNGSPFSRIRNNSHLIFFYVVVRQISLDELASVIS